MIRDEVPYLELQQAIKERKKAFNSSKFNYYQQPQMMMDPYGGYGYYPYQMYPMPYQYPCNQIPSKNYIDLSLQSLVGNQPGQYIRKNRDNYRYNKSGPGYGYEGNGNGYRGGYQKRYNKGADSTEAESNATEEFSNDQNVEQQNDGYQSGGYRRKKRIPCEQLLMNVFCK